jgi:AcrR family transcriptional regulator
MVLCGAGASAIAKVVSSVLYRPDGMEPSLTRDRILDAALAVIGEAGACRMTLDAVAARAEVSKGGLLYHFPDKEALLRGLLDRHLDRRQAWFGRAQQEHGTATADVVHARVDVVRMPEMAPAALPMLGILALEPKLLARPQAENAHYLERLRQDPARFVQAVILSLATTGLIMSEAMGTIPLTAAEREAVIAELHHLADRLR